MYYSSYYNAKYAVTCCQMSPRLGKCEVSKDGWCSDGRCPHSPINGGKLDALAPEWNATVPVRKSFK